MRESALQFNSEDRESEGFYGAKTGRGESVLFSLTQRTESQRDFTVLFKQCNAGRRYYIYGSLQVV